MTRTRKWLFAAILLGVVATTWTGAFLFWLLFDPTIAQWTLIVTGVAIVTEVAMWLCVVLLGLTTLNRFRMWARLRRSPTAQGNGGSSG